MRPALALAASGRRARRPTRAGGNGVAERGDRDLDRAQLQLLPGDRDQRARAVSGRPARASAGGRRVLRADDPGPCRQRLRDPDARPRRGRAAGRRDDGDLGGDAGALPAVGLRDRRGHAAGRLPADAAGRDLRPRVRPGRSERRPPVGGAVRPRGRDRAAAALLARAQGRGRAPDHVLAALGSPAVSRGGGRRQRPARELDQRRHRRSLAEPVRAAVRRGRGTAAAGDHSDAHCHSGAQACGRCRLRRRSP